MIRKQIYIITGGPGFGKTELIEELRKSGYLCSGEFARDLIETQLTNGGDVLPWKNPKLFQLEVLKQRIAFFESVPDRTIAFADRGIPDQLAFARYKGFVTPEILAGSASEYRYATHVFVTPPWPEIFVNDAIRSETYEEAVRIHQAVLETYSGLNYQIIELPLISVRKRIEYLLQTTLKLRTL
ncbi:MAG TPA: AAA family ATPase [Prolixibacteraceae bacterium]|nr:AAA family ATPase [Prolixibacteraceae bacterium]